MKRYTNFQAILVVFAIAFFCSCSKSGSNNPKPPNPGTVISSLSVDSGPYATPVVINGTGFSSTKSDDLVYFNGELAVIDFASSNQLTVEVPLGAGTGNVTISVSHGTIVKGPVFTYVLSPF